MIFLILIYSMLSATGLVFLKMGTGHNLVLSIIGGSLKIEVNWRLLLGFVIYIAAFITSLIAMRMSDLSYFYPISAGLVYVLVCIESFFILKETFTLNQLIGIGFIMFGVICMNIRK